MVSTMGAVRLVSFSLVFLSSFTYGHYVPRGDYGVVARQDVSNSSQALGLAAVTSSPSSSPTITTSSDTATITSSATLSTSSDNGTCLTSYPAGYPITYATYADLCRAAQADVDSNWEMYAEKCLRDYCDTSLQLEISKWTTRDLPLTTTTRLYFSGAYGSGSESTVIVTQSYWTETQIYTNFPARMAKIVPPCCGQCTIKAQTVHLFFWASDVAGPTPTVTGLPASATGVVSQLTGDGSYVDDSGFTFISPSVYIGFTSVGATDRCGDVGTKIINSTVGFDPSELSTVRVATVATSCLISDSPTYTYTSEIFTTPDPVLLTFADVAQDCSTIEGYYYFTENTWYADAGDPCHPVIALPTRVRELQPEWNDCVEDANGGFYDPPTTLKQGFVLVPSTAAPGGGGTTPAPSTTPPALPDTTPSSTPDPEPPASSDPPVDPPSSDPPTPPASDPPNPPASDPPTPPASDPPNPPASNPPNPPASNPPNPPASNPPNPPADPPASNPPGDQPPPPAPGGSSTTVVITPPPPQPTNGNPGNPPANPPPVITLPPANPGGNPGPVVTLTPIADPNNPSQSVVIIGSQTLTPGSSITIGGTTSTLPNGETTVISGTQVTLDPGATQVVVGSSTFTIPTVPESTAPLEITLDGTTLTANSNTQFVLGPGTTLSVGGPALTIDGTTYQLTTNEQGSTVLIAGTSGASSAATVSATTTPDSFATGTGGVAPTETEIVFPGAASGMAIPMAGLLGVVFGGLLLWI
ncbi:hypothetical protein P154DRAFT_560714 [Amniculicola lignicola CBS 123094]|uniref:Lytic polysaccharide monooxygenase n=1 Tax=Amniculicola lignicola CBS 123094 TaxID=1392246 RepID=A0A6A5WQS7_9PLEO|nr:hypothetical protein P154DRAFT_560714 [Amniculicola lignicola CBS 123094]